ncbi:MAG: hypothetical protein AAGA59_11225 [Actinomycetota bacterium]
MTAVDPTTASEAPTIEAIEATSLVTTLPRSGTSRLRLVGLPTALALALAAAVALVISVGADDVQPSGLQNSFTPSTLGAEVAAPTTQPTLQTEATDPVGEQLDDEQPEVDPAPFGATRFEPVETAPVLDTEQPLAPGESVTVEPADIVDPTATAVAVSVTVRGAPATGALTAAFDAGTVTVVDVEAPMVSQLAIVPRNGEAPLTLTAASGGRLTVDVVGQFVPSEATAAGRIVAVEPIVIGSLTTAIDGSSATFAPVENAELPTGGVDSVLIRIAADIGDEGGTVRIGPDLDDLSQSLMWGPTTAGDRTRMGLAIVPLDELEQLSLDYQGGAELQVQLLAYITGEGAPVSTNGLFVPLPATRLIATADRGETLDAAAEQAPVLDLGPYLSADTLIGSAALSADNGLTIASAAATGRLSVAPDLGGDVETIGYFLA